MNRRGLVQRKKRRDVVHYICQTDSNVVFLQDTHMTESHSFLSREGCTESTLPFFNNLWKGKCYHSYYSSVSRGTYILIESSIQHNLIKETVSDCGNYVFIICKINTDTFAFINIYGPNTDNPNFFENIYDYLEQIEIDHVVIGGDMNFTVDPDNDCLNYRRENNLNAKSKFLQLANSNGLIDIWTMETSTSC